MRTKSGPANVSVAIAAICRANQRKVCAAQIQLRMNSTAKSRPAAPAGVFKFLLKRCDSSRWNKTMRNIKMDGICR